ncbi:MAG: DUF3488 and transglutaminase-like domain-containing protein [Myxococcota bacterium]|nr:DUF3488 and transglutaminase-like domain-containing protein [Myxococcota bacterium]
MRFKTVHKVCSYLMVVTSLTALTMTGELNPIALGLTAVFLSLSWFWEPPRVNPASFTTGWNVLTLLMLGRTIFEIVTGGSVIIAAIYCIIFLTVNKLFNRIASKDYLQLYVVSLLQMISATVLSTDLAFGVLFLLYIVFSTWTLIVFNLRREMESNLLFKYSLNDDARPVEMDRLLNSKRLVGGRFLLTTSSISILIFVASGIFFFLFPRVGFRLFNQARPGISMAGFSDRVELGHFGTIKDDPTVVMRVEFESPEARSQLQPYWRGISLDHYDGRSWSKSLAKSKRSLPRRGHRYQLRTPDPESRVTIRQSIYLEPMETRVVFALQDLTSVEFPQLQNEIELPGRYRAIQRDFDGDIHYEQSDEIAFRYVAVSHSPTLAQTAQAVPLDQYRKNMRLYTKEVSARFVQQPNGQIERIRAKAAEVVGDAKTLADAIQRIENYLRTEFTYTLTSTRVAHLAPLSNFLFRDRRGHCEYFATAMVIMLRTLGIGARLVNGFLGGQWNGFGQYLAVTQGDAHSWVEVHLPERRCARGQCHWRDRWLARDPTPSGRSGDAQSSVWRTMRQYADALRMRWFKYIIEYNLESQMNALLSLRKFLPSGRPKSSARTSESAETSKLSFDGQWLMVLGAALLAAIAFVLLRRRRNGSPEDAVQLQQSQRRANELIRRLIRRYGQHGYSHRPAMTINEYVEYLHASNAPGQMTISAVLDVYNPSRFGRGHLSEEDFATLARAIDGVQFGDHPVRAPRGAE